MDNIDRAALRHLARLAWDRRQEIALSSADLEQLLVAWMAIGSPEEGEAASELLAAIRAAEAKQANFDRLLRQQGN